MTVPVATFDRIRIRVTENVLLYTNTGWVLLVVRCVCAGMRESLTEVISKSLSKLATQSEGGETVIDETLLS